MVKTLQKRFIRAAMLAVTLLTAVFLTAVNLLNYWSVTGDVQKTMRQILSENAMEKPDGPEGRSPEGGAGPGSRAEEPEMPQGEAAGAPPEASGAERPEPPEAAPPDISAAEQPSLPEAAPPENVKAEDREALPGSRGREAGDLSSERYFYVRVTGDEKIIYTDLTHIRSLEEDEAEELVKAAAGKNAPSGHVSGFIFRRENDPETGGAVYSFLDEQHEIRNLSRTFMITMITGGAIWLVMLFLVTVLSKRAIRPVAENIERQRRFVTDAGHELKTPLAIIAANADVLELHMGDNKWIRNIRAQTLRLSELTANLLMLSRMDEEGARPAAAAFNASEVLDEVLDSFTENIRLRGIALTRDVPPETMLCYPPEIFRQLVTILIDNAVKYTDEGGEIRAALAPSGKGVLLTMENSCLELPGEDPSKLFDRFYRADEARSRKTGGSGIGLAAARAAAEMSGGRIEADYPEAKRIRFRAWLKQMNG